MTILTELARLYDRMAAEGRAPRPGYSSEKISFSLEIDADGNPVALRDKRSLAGKKPAPVLMAVPQPPKDRKGRKIVPGLLWDPSPYALGVSSDADGCLSLNDDNAAAKFAAFREKHIALLKSTDDPGFLAFVRFLSSWNPSDFAQFEGYREALKTNIVFEVYGISGPRFLHQRRLPGETVEAPSGVGVSSCLVTGEIGPVARLHPLFGGITDKQAAIVSFNIGSKDERGAASSYGKSQGDNAPVSQAAAFAYGTALNALLERQPEGAPTRNLRVGDTTVVFWAQAAAPEAASWAEILMAQALNPPDEDAEAKTLQAAIESVAAGRGTGDPRLDPATRVFLLGLAPNAARLSVRFWHPGSFGDFARNVQRFWDDLTIAPSPWKNPPAAWSLLYEIALLGDAKNIPPLLGGQMMRAVLTGQPLPRSLLAATIARIRADGDINGRRAAICKAVINRHSKQEEIPVSLDPDNPSPAYRLGRLFAVLEQIQQRALPGLNATIKDRYFAAASATPARVFPVLVKNATHHLSLMRKEGGGLGYWFDARMGEIWSGLGPDLPLSLNLEDQGRFVAGYYHERFDRKSKDADDVIEQPEAQNVAN